MASFGSSWYRDTDKNFDDAFIEDSELNSAILDLSSKATTDKTMRCLNNSSTTTKEEIAADCRDTLEDLNSVNCSEFSSENIVTWKMAGITPKSADKNCIWEFAGITPKSTDKSCIWEIAGIMPKSTDKSCIWEIAGIMPKSTDKNCIWEIAGITPKSTDKKCIWESTGTTPKSRDKNCIWESAGTTPKSRDKNCIWESGGTSPKSTYKTVCTSAKQDGLMDYSTTSMLAPSLKESLSTISVQPKNCSVIASDSLLTFNDSPSKKTHGFSSSLRSFAFEELVSNNVSQNQLLKSSLATQNDIVKADNRCRGERKGAKPLQARTMLAKKRAWKEKDDPKKRKCLNPSITTVPLVSLKDSTSRMLQSLPLNSSLETNNDVVNTDSWVKSRRMIRPGSEKKFLAESTKAVKKCTKNVGPRKRKHLGQLVEETFALSQPMSENETSLVKFSLHSDETVCPLPIKDVSVDITRWAAPSASDENLLPISCDVESSNCDVCEQNCILEMYFGEKLLPVQGSNSVFVNKSTEPSSDENAVLYEELKNWEPFSTDDFSKTVGATTEDTEVTLQNNEASDPNLARTQLLSDQLKNAKVKKNRRKSMSADREIASQMVEMPSPEMTDSSQTFLRKRYLQRLRRRSTELFQFTQIGAFCDVGEAPMTVQNEGSQPERNIPTVGNETEMHLVSQSLVSVNDMKLGESTGRSGDELTLDFDASILNSDLNLYHAPAKPSRSRLRRKSTELYRLSQNNLNQPLASLREMPEQESTSSQEAQNDNVCAETRRKQNGMNKLPRCPKQKKKAKVEEGPPLEDIYLNRLWRSQMPKDAVWETIPEDPKYNRETGGIRLFSTRKAKRFLDFEEGPSLLHLKKRKLKAMKNGWKPLTKKRDHALSKLLVEKLTQLDGEIGIVEYRV